MRRMRGGIAVALATLTMAACAALPPAQWPPAGDSPIWDVRAGRYVDRDLLERRVIATPFRLLGEVHDNPTHHALRAELLRAIGRAGKRPAVVFEQFDVPHDPALQEAQRNQANAEALARAGALDRRSWEWPLHEPLIAAALAESMPVRAGNASRAALEPVVKAGNVDGIDARWRALLDGARWDEHKTSELSREIADSHCGKMPAAAVPRLALAQRVRDAALAASLLADATADGAVLIAGNGHVRADLGVPLYLGPERKSISVGWVEVDAEDARGRDLVREVARVHPGFDYLWLTDAVHRPDPCASIPAARQPAAPPEPGSIQPREVMQ